MPANIDQKTVSGFGDEWTRFSQTEMPPLEKERIFRDYFKIFPWHLLPEGGGTGADIGCGSGRWAVLVAPRVGHLHLVDASDAALKVAKTNLASISNVSFHHASVDSMPIQDTSLDFAYSLGVLHHLPDTQSAIFSIAKKLKSRAPFLVYLYYAFDNRPAWYRWLWHVSNGIRLLISHAPHPIRYLISQGIAVVIYWPMARFARVIEQSLGFAPKSWPLAHYRDKSFYTMRTDALDRFGTRLEHRFSRKQILDMLEAAGFVNVQFSNGVPYWCAVGIKS